MKVNSFVQINTVQVTDLEWKIWTCAFKNHWIFSI